MPAKSHQRLCEIRTYNVKELWGSGHANHGLMPLLQFGSDPGRHVSFSCIAVHTEHTPFGQLQLCGFWDVNSPSFRSKVK